MTQLLKLTYFSYFVILLLASNHLFAQDNHFWAQQYGAKSTLLGGAVVGGVRDNSAIYYNPGAAGFIDQISISVNANAYKFETIDITNGAGDGINLRSNRLSLYPQLISSIRSFKKNESWKWGFALLTRNQSNVRIHQRKEMFYDVIPNLSGNEEFIGTYDYENTMNELWGGLNISHRLNKHVSIGISQFISYRNQLFSVRSDRNVIPSNSNTASYFSASASDFSYVNFTNFKAIWKLGIALEFNRWRIGITATSPSIQLFGTGTVTREIISNDVGRYYNTVPTNNPKIPNYTASAEQKLDNKIQYKSPFSVAIGLEYHLPHDRFFFTAEYFGEIGQYNVASPDLEPFIRPSTVELSNTKIPKSTEFLAVTTLSRPVLNFAGAYEHDFSDKLTIHLGFRTDYDSFDRSKGDEKTIPLAATYWDLYHFSGGLSFHKNKDIVTLGANFSYGGAKSSANLQYINFSQPLDARYFLGVQDYTANTTVRALSLVIGYTRIIKPKEERKATETK